MISEIDIKDWDVKKARDIIVDNEQNALVNGRMPLIGYEEMTYLLKFFEQAEAIRRSFVPQVPALFK